VFKLLSTTGEQSIDLQPGRIIVVGRAVTSDVPIYDPTISRRHAEVSLADGGVKVKDVGSSNGTFLNGARITEAIAVENDVITFGKVAFRVKEVSAPVLRPQVVPSVSAEFTVQNRRAGTIVRQLPVSVSGGVPAIVTAAPRGRRTEGHRQVAGGAAREEARAVARDLQGPVQAAGAGPAARQDRKAHQGCDERRPGLHPAA